MATSVHFKGTGDPYAATLTNAYRNGGGGAIGDCSFTDFGVAFIRDEAYDVDDYGPDFVGLVFGKKAAQQQQAPVEQKPAEKPDVVCNPETDESATVPAGQQCKPKAAVQCPPGGPQTSVPAGQNVPGRRRMPSRCTFDRGFGTWGVNVRTTQASAVAAPTQRPVSVGLPGRDEAFDIAPERDA